MVHPFFMLHQGESELLFCVLAFGYALSTIAFLVLRGRQSRDTNELK